MLVVPSAFTFTYKRPTSKVEKNTNLHDSATSSDPSSKSMAWKKLQKIRSFLVFGFGCLVDVFLGWCFLMFIFLWGGGEHREFLSPATSGFVGSSGNMGAKWFPLWLWIHSYSQLQVGIYNTKWSDPLGLVITSNQLQKYLPRVPKMMSPLKNFMEKLNFHSPFQG